MIEAYYNIYGVYVTNIRCLVDHVHALSCLYVAFRTSLTSNLCHACSLDAFTFSTKVALASRLSHEPRQLRYKNFQY
jgi:hypothetical protein